MSKERRIFVSCPSGDATRVEAILGELGTRIRKKLWFYRTDCEKGSSWLDEHEGALSSASAFVFFLSRHTPTAWYQRAEVVIAIDLHRRGLAARLLPVYLDGVPPPATMPYGLQLFTAVDGTEGKNRLKAELTRFCDRALTWTKKDLTESRELESRTRSQRDTLRVTLTSIPEPVFLSAISEVERRVDVPDATRADRPTDLRREEILTWATVNHRLDLLARALMQASIPPDRWLATYPALATWPKRTERVADGRDAWLAEFRPGNYQTKTLEKFHAIATALRCAMAAHELPAGAHGLQLVHRTGAFLVIDHDSPPRGLDLVLRFIRGATLAPAVRVGIAWGELRPWRTPFLQHDVVGEGVFRASFAVPDEVVPQAGAALPDNLRIRVDDADCNAFCAVGLGEWLAPRSPRGVAPPGDAAARPTQHDGEVGSTEDPRETEVAAIRNRWFQSPTSGRPDDSRTESSDQREARLPAGPGWWQLRSGEVRTEPSLAVGVRVQHPALRSIGAGQLAKEGAILKELGAVAETHLPALARAVGAQGRPMRPGRDILFERANTGFQLLVFAEPSTVSDVRSWLLTVVMDLAAREPLSDVVVAVAVGHVHRSVVADAPHGSRTVPTTAPLIAELRELVQAPKAVRTGIQLTADAVRYLRLEGHTATAQPHLLLLETIESVLEAEDIQLVVSKWHPDLPRPDFSGGDPGRALLAAMSKRLLSAPCPPSEPHPASALLAVATRDGIWHAVLDSLLVLQIILVWALANQDLEAQSVLAAPPGAAELFRLVCSTLGVVCGDLYLWSPLERTLAYFAACAAAVALLARGYAMVAAQAYRAFMLGRFLPSLPRYLFPVEGREVVERWSLGVRRALARRHGRFRELYRRLGGAACLWLPELGLRGRYQPLLGPGRARPWRTSVPSREEIPAHVRTLWLPIFLLGPVTYSLATAGLFYIAKRIALLKPESGATPYVLLSMVLGSVLSFAMTLRIFRIDLGTLLIRRSALVRQRESLRVAWAYDWFAYTALFMMGLLLALGAMRAGQLEPGTNSTAARICAAVGFIVLFIDGRLCFRPYSRATQLEHELAEAAVGPSQVERHVNSLPATVASKLHTAARLVWRGLRGYAVNASAAPSRQRPPVFSTHPLHGALRQAYNQRGLLRALAGEMGDHHSLVAVKADALAYRCSEAELARAAWFATDQYGRIVTVSLGRASPYAGETESDNTSLRGLVHVEQLYEEGFYAARAVAAVARHAEPGTTLEFHMFGSERFDQRPFRLLIKVYAPDEYVGGYIGVAIPT